MSTSGERRRASPTVVAPAASSDLRSRAVTLPATPIKRRASTMREKGGTSSSSALTGSAAWTSVESDQALMISVATRKVAHQENLWPLVRTVLDLPIHGIAP